jgi:CheY-like chemotaxis protein
MTSTRAIRQHEEENNISRCRIVALTGLASATARLEALSSGVDHFMTKPVNFKALSELMRKEDERRRVIDQKEVEREEEQKEGGEVERRPESSEGGEEKEETKELEKREGGNGEGVRQEEEVLKADDVLQEKKEPKAEEPSKEEAASKEQESTTEHNHDPPQHKEIFPIRQPSESQSTSQEALTSLAEDEAPNKTPVLEKVKQAESSPTQNHSIEHPPSIKTLEETSSKPA